MLSVISGHHGCMTARDVVFQPGDRVRTCGRLVPGPSQISGHITMVGRWHGPASDEQVRPGDESIDVETQTPEGPPPRPRADRTHPPCAPPPGGWPHSAVADLDLDIRDLESSGAMVHRAVFRPSEDQEVLVVAATASATPTPKLSPSPQPNPLGSPPSWAPGPTLSPQAYSSSTRQSPPPENQQPSRQGRQQAPGEQRTPRIGARCQSNGHPCRRCPRASGHGRRSKADGRCLRVGRNRDWRGGIRGAYVSCLRWRGRVRRIGGIHQADQAEPVIAWADPDG